MAYYWCRNGGDWSVVPYLHAERDLNGGAVAEGAVVALGVANLLRRALWSSDLRRSTRLGSLSAAGLILALLLTGSWLAPRRSYYLKFAAHHHVLEGMHGEAPWAISTPEFPPDAGKAAYHRRMRERYEHAAQFPWLSVKTDAAEVR